MDTKAKRKARQKLSSQNGWVCHYCGCNLVPDNERDRYCEQLPGGCFTPIEGYDMPQIDHLIPVSRGGKSEVDNLVLSCGKCNHTKNDKTETEFTEWRRKA